jgi:hypothetical protein
MSSRLVFVSYTHLDRERVRPLVNLLDQKLRSIGGAVFWDEKLAVGAPISQTVAKLLSEAACVLVVWTNHSVSSQWVHGECELARKDGRLVPIRLDGGAEIPPPFNVLKHAELANWTGDESPAFATIWHSVRNLVERGSGAAQPYGALAENVWVIQDAAEASGELRSLAGRFRSINEVLVANTPPVQDLRQALEQVMATYRVVNKAVQGFTIPALKPGALDPEPYVHLAHGNLMNEIEAGRGHCGTILVHYRRVGGVRDAIQGRLSEAQLLDVDDTFEKLGDADGDAFARMTRIGEYLSEESRAVINHLLTHQDAAARERVASTRALLEPLERELSDGMKEMQQLEASLGGTTRPRSD